MLCASPLAHANSIVLNGGFSQGSTGWTYNPSSDSPWSFSNNGSYSYASPGCTGANCIAPDSNPHSAFLYQDLATTPGASYTLSFAYADAGIPSELKVLFGKNVAADLSNNGPTGLTVYTVSGLVTTSAVTQLEFLARDDASFNQLTSVSVTRTPTETPEPSSLALVGTGGLALYLVNRRKRHS